MNISIQNLFALILKNVTQVDYREKARLINNGDKITKTNYLVITIEEILSITESLKLGLCLKDECVFIYNEKYWAQIEPYEFKRFLGNSALKMGVPYVEAKFYGFIEGLYKQFFASATLPSFNYDKNKVLINLLNGTFVFEDGVGSLKDFEKEDFITYQLPFEYNPNAESPLFKSYLNQVLPDESLQAILAEYIGFIFTKGLKLEKCLLLYGNGANGKSVFFDIVNALLGKENITNYTLGSLSEEQNRAMIANKLLNYGSEIRGNIDADFFKQLVSGEPVHCRLKYGNPFICEDYARLMFNCNELPQQVEISDAYFRRFLIIPFDVTIPEDERDVELSKKIIASELSGIFNWVLDGLQRLLRNKNFTHSTTIKEMVSEYKLESDSVALFLKEECIQPSNSEIIKFKDLYEEYKHFCDEEGRRQVRRTKFSRRLKALGLESTRQSSGTMIYASKETPNKVSQYSTSYTSPTLTIRDEVYVQSEDDMETLPF